jgi:organic radical activating enzyme
MPIDSKNNTICSYPFVHSYIGSQYERKLCCISDDIVELQKTTLGEFWNSDYMRETRKKMVSGEKVDACSRCYYFEEMKVPSLREESCRHYTEEDLFEGYDPETGIMNKNPTYFDHRTIYCNLQCVSCGYVYSSTHMSLYEKMWNKTIEFKADNEFEENTAKEILDSLINKECKNIYWAGGEPMMSKVHWMVVELMEKLSNDPEYSDYIKKIGVHYNTNLTKLTWRGKHIPDMLEFYQPSIQASIDGTNETFEYCRDGARWNLVSKNWDEYFKKLNKNEQFGIASVLSSPVLMDIDRWFDFFEQYNVKVYNHKYICHHEAYPDAAQGFLDIRLFPQHIFDKVVNHAMNRFSNSKLINAHKSVDIINSYVQEKETHKEFFENTDMLKKLKKNSEYRDKFNKGSKTYPELLQIINPEAYEWYMSI